MMPPVDKPSYAVCAGSVTTWTPRYKELPYRIWGEGLEPTPLQQMENACKLPVAVAGALMPDAHVGYGLPIGGVLATENAVIPYAVGVDIACRMKMTVLDLPVSALDDRSGPPDAARSSAKRASASARRFKSQRAARRAWTRTGASRRSPRRTEGPGLGAARDERQRQSFRRVRHAHGRTTMRSGSPRRDLPRAAQPLGQPRHRRAGRAALQQAGARARIPSCRRSCRTSRGSISRREAGQEYWAAMELMGRYAAANHALIHQHIARTLGVERAARPREPPQLRLARTASAAGRHRSARSSSIARARRRPAKACSASFPGSMATPGYVVRGKGVGGVAELGVARRRPPHEPHARRKALFTWDAAQRSCASAASRCSRPDSTKCRWPTRTSTRSWPLSRISSSRWRGSIRAW